MEKGGELIQNIHLISVANPSEQLKYDFKSHFDWLIYSRWPSFLHIEYIVQFSTNYSEQKIIKD